MKSNFTKHIFKSNKNVLEIETIFEHFSNNYNNKIKAQHLLNKKIKNFHYDECYVFNINDPNDSGERGLNKEYYLIDDRFPIGGMHTGGVNE